MSVNFTGDFERDSRARAVPVDEDKNTMQEVGIIAINRHSQQYSSTAMTTSRGCILIVDDNEFVREILTELLESEGYLALQAGDATRALMILRHDPAIDVLVTDLTMPGGDGITLIRHAREIRHDLPAILLTGHAEQVTSLAATADGNFHVLGKPVESDSLIGQLERLMKLVSG